MITFSVERNLLLSNREALQKETSVTAAAPKSMPHSTTKGGPTTRATRLLLSTPSPSFSFSSNTSQSCSAAEILSSISAGLLDATNASYAPLNLNEELMRTLFLVAFRLATGQQQRAIFQQPQNHQAASFGSVPLLLLAIQTFLPFATRYFAVASCRCCLHCRFAFRCFSIRGHFVPQPTNRGICHNTLPISFELKCHLCAIRKLRRSCCCMFLYASFCHSAACCRLVSVACFLFMHSNCSVGVVVVPSKLTK